jgi:hypothetical protein
VLANVGENGLGQLGPENYGTCGGRAGLGKACDPGGVKFQGRSQPGSHRARQRTGLDPGTDLFTRALFQHAI